jgi:hypothetical protein
VFVPGTEYLEAAMTWALMRRRRDDRKWEFCGFTEHDEKAAEFEEDMLLEQKEKYDRVETFRLEDY